MLELRARTRSSTSVAVDFELGGLERV